MFINGIIVAFVVISFIALGPRAVAPSVTRPIVPRVKPFAMHGRGAAQDLKGWNMSAHVPPSIQSLRSTIEAIDRLCDLLLFAAANLSGKPLDVTDNQTLDEYIDKRPELERKWLQRIQTIEQELTIRLDRLSRADLTNSVDRGRLFEIRLWEWQDYHKSRHPTKLEIITRPMLVVRSNLDALELHNVVRALEIEQKKVRDKLIRAEAMAGGPPDISLPPASQPRTSNRKSKGSSRSESLVTQEVIEGLTSKQIGHRLGINHGTIINRRAKAIKVLSPGKGREYCWVDVQNIVQSYAEAKADSPQKRIAVAWLSAGIQCEWDPNGKPIPQKALNQSSSSAIKQTNN